MLLTFFHRSSHYFWLCFISYMFRFCAHFYFVASKKRSKVNYLRRRNIYWGVRWVPYRKLCINTCRKVCLSTAIEWVLLFPLDVLVVCIWSDYFCWFNSGIGLHCVHFFTKFREIVIYGDLENSQIILNMFQLLVASYFSIISPIPHSVVWVILYSLSFMLSCNHISIMIDCFLVVGDRSVG